MSLAVSSISPTAIMGSVPRWRNVAYSSVPATITPITPPVSATTASTPPGTS